MHHRIDTQELIDGPYLRPLTY